MFLKGFGFGMLLQIAVGPVCLYVLNTAVSAGFFSALAAATAVTVVDTLYIVLAVLGIGAFFKKNRRQLLFKIAGGSIVFLFGLYILAGAMGFRLPSIYFKAGSVYGPFLSAFILTASNPLTILFWSGVFSSKISESHDKKNDVLLFSAGSACSTFVFLTLAGLAGALFHYFLPETAITVLNIIAGIVLVLSAVKFIIQKEQVYERTD